MKRWLVLVAVAGCLAVSGAGAAGSSMATASIARLAASDSQLSTLVSLVKHAGLAGALSGKAKLTVFAPTNAAFAALPKATLTALGKDKAMLRKVLEYHIVAGALPAAKVLKLHSAKTLEGATVTFAVRGQSAFVNDAKIIRTNLDAANGVVHVINRVLMPPS